MNVVIIAPDNRVAVDGVFRTVSVDLPGVVSVRFDGTAGNVEHFVEEPRTITAEEFQAEFGALVTAWGEAPDDRAARTPAPASAPAPDIQRQLLEVQTTLALIRQQVTGT